MRSESLAMSAGVVAGMSKVAVSSDVGEVVYGALSANLEPGIEPGPDDDLETLLPGPGELERALIFIEDRFDIRFGDKVMMRLMATGTVSDLVSEVSRALMPGKTAAYDRRAYMAKREQHKARARSYRMANAARLRRQARVYRKKISRGQIRPKRRVGSAGSGFIFVQR